MVCDSTTGATGATGAAAAPGDMSLERPLGVTERIRGTGSIVSKSSEVGVLSRGTDGGTIAGVWGLGAFPIRKRLVGFAVYPLLGTNHPVRLCYFGSLN